MPIVSLSLDIIRTLYPKCYPRILSRTFFTKNIYPKSYPNSIILHNWMVEQFSIESFRRFRQNISFLKFTFNLIKRFKLKYFLFEQLFCMGIRIDLEKPDMPNFHLISVIYLDLSFFESFP